MLGKKKSIVGLDIGSSEIKAVELTKVGDGVKITGFGHAVLPSPDLIGETVAELFQRAGIKSKRVVTSVSGRSVIVRYITMPPMTQDELDGALRFEADKYIPFEIEDVSIDGQKLEDIENESSGDQEMRVLLCAVKKTLIQEHIGTIQELGMQPVAIDVDAFALCNAFELRSTNSPRVEEEDRIVALVDLGSSKTNISILKGNTSYFSREVYLAGDDLTEAIGRQLQIDTSEAEALKKNPEGREGEIEDAVSPVLDDLANEIHLSFDYFENQFDREVGEVYVSGGGAMTPGLETVFERVFDRKIQFWDPTENLELLGDKIDIESLKAHASQLPIAIGLSSRLLDLS